MMLSIEGGPMGNRWSQRAAFPRQRETEQRWKRWRIESAGETPKRWPRRRPILDNEVVVASLMPPRASKARGMKETPTARQAGAWADIFRCSATARAWPAEEAAPWRVRGWRGEMTVTSIAAGWPRSQLGRRMSAGRLCDPGMREGTSFRGAKAAERAAWKIESHIYRVVPKDSIRWAAEAQPA